MKKLFVIFLLLLTQVFITLEIKAQEKKRVFEVPLKYVSFLIFNDPECPLQLSNPRVLADNEGYLHYSYTIFNDSDKSLKSFQIEEFDAFVNPSYGATPNAKTTDEFLFPPYDSFTTLGDENRFEIKSLNEKQAANFKLSENRKRIWVVIVTKVESFNGKTYDATSKYTSIKKFIDQITNEDYEAEDNGTPKLTAEEKETKLRNFITEKVQNNVEFR